MNAWFACTNSFRTDYLFNYMSQIETALQVTINVKNNLIKIQPEPLNS